MSDAKISTTSRADRTTFGSEAIRAQCRYGYLAQRSDFKLIHYPRSLLQSDRSADSHFRSRTFKLALIERSFPYDRPKVEAPVSRPLIQRGKTQSQAEKYSVPAPTSLRPMQTAAPPPPPGTWREPAARADGGAPRSGRHRPDPFAAPLIDGSAAPAVDGTAI